MSIVIPIPLLRNAAGGTFDSFDRLSPEAVCVEIVPYQTVPVLRLDREAHGIFLEWRTDLERRLRSSGLPPALESHLAKYRKLVPALARINHLGRWWRWASQRIRIAAGSRTSRVP
jgi:hypothetical protein